MKGIIFKESIFHKVVRGVKTQDRQIINPQPITVFHGTPVRRCNNLIGIKDIKPYHKVGEILYLKEPYSLMPNGEVVYKHSQAGWQYSGKWEGWKNPITMPGKHARFFIKITTVRCERLQDISDEDCFQSGVIRLDLIGKTSTAALKSAKEENLILHYETPREAYAALINERYGKGTWESNPYVWVYGFILKRLYMM